ERVIRQQSPLWCLLTNWWRLSSTNKKKKVYFPIRIGQKTKIILKEREFFIIVIINYSESSFLASYYCESGSFFSIKLDLTSAISTLLLNIPFISISFSLGEYKIFIFGIGSSSNSEWNYAGPGYKSSLLRTTNGKHVLYVSKIEDNFCALEIYKDFNIKDRIEGSSPNEVWQRLNIQKYTGIQLFGLENPEVQSFIRQYHVLSCLPNNWPDYALMKFFFDYHLKRRTLADINWHTLFLNWHKDQNNIIELYSSLESLYPPDYQFSDREIGAWHAMLRACGCHNVTPWTPEESQARFKILQYQLWTKNTQPENDRAMLQQLYSLGFLNSSPSHIPNKTRIFWQCFNQALMDNKKTRDGKRRVLSIIANDFSYSDLKTNLGEMMHEIAQNLRRYLRKDFATNLKVSPMGVALHSPCISHCLQQAFDNCNLDHPEICKNCNELFTLFSNLTANVDSEFHESLI
ncbi:16494_t:CDS:2, partial [Dentiscutata heterogama]